MAGEMTKTTGIVLSIRPWSRTSHIVVWLTPDAGRILTVVKGAVRPKSAFLGQYDLFYSCGLVYYARERGELHALRETWPLKTRDGLRGRWRETALAGYAASLADELAPSNAESAAWFDLLDGLYDRLATGFTAEPDGARTLVRFELDALRLAGLEPDLRGGDPRAEWEPFALDRGHYGDGTRTVRLARATAAALRAPERAEDPQILLDALRFLGVFLSFHLEGPADVRRAVVKMVVNEGVAR